MAQVQAQPQAPVSGPAGTGVASGGGGGNQFPSTSLYVGDLELNVTDAQLFDVFNQVGQVVSVRVCRDINTRRSLGYAYVNYSNPVDAARALEMLNFTPLNGKPIRIMYSNRDPTMRKSGAGNIFIKNLDKSIDNKALYDTFSAFGNILSCKIATDPSGQSKGYGFVQFDQEEAAHNAIEKLNGMLLNDKKVFVGPFLRRQDRENTANSTKFNNVFVKNLSESATEDNLLEIFGEYGNITSAVVMREGDGKSKCFGFVNFEDPEHAAKAVKELNGKKFDGKEWYVGKAQKKSEREMELKGRFEQRMQEAADKNQGANLYLKNLDDSIGDDKLRELFSEFGTITSCKVMRDPNGVSRGSGFVAFQSPDDASKALAEMNGRMIGSKPLYVALAQRKEDRRARLQAQFSQIMRPVAMPPSVAPRVPMYPPGAPGMGQQLFYGQPPPALIPPQPGFGFQQPLVPGMRPGVAAMPNFYMPLVQQGQQAQRPGGRRAGPVQQTQQHPMPLIQQQMLPRGGRAYRYPPGRNMPDVPMPGVAGGMLSAPYDMGVMPMRDAGMSQPIPIGALASALANASPEQQRTMLGESLYPLVDQLEHEHAAKVTGMLLEMDQPEVLHLLESPEALKAKVAEAMEVLRNVAQQQQQASTPADQLAALSLNDGIIIVLKSIVYGGLIESVTSLSVVSSAAGTDASTLKIVALGLANLAGGFFVIVHDLFELRNARDEATDDQKGEPAGRYWEVLGRRANFKLHATIAILSYLLVGIMPPLIYGFSFRESNGTEYKLIAVAAAGLLCISLLAIGKAHVKPQKAYIKYLLSYLSLGVSASGLSYVAGLMISRLLEKLGLFDSNASVSAPPSIIHRDISSTVPAWASY